MSLSPLQKPDRQQLLPWIITGVAALLACWFLVQLLSLWLAPPAGDYPRLQPQQQQIAASSFSGAWFGGNSPGQVANNRAVPAEELPKARLDAQLLGVVLLGDNAVANIAHGKKRDGVFRVGDEITNNVTVEAIEAHRVVIREQGQYRQINLQALGGSTVKTREPASAERNLKQAPANAFASGTELAPGLSTVTLPSGQVGLQLSADTFTRLSKYGLQQGELVTDIDGTSVDQLMADRSRLMGLMNRSSVQVTLYRDGRSRQIQLQPSVVASSVMPGFVR